MKSALYIIAGIILVGLLAMIAMFCYCAGGYWL